IVTDGGFRDSPEIAKLDIPAYHHRPAAPTNLTVHQAIDINVPIGCGDAPVFPGDVVVGDAEGVVVVPAHLADEIADEAVEMTAFEDFDTESKSGCGARECCREKSTNVFGCRDVRLQSTIDREHLVTPLDAVDALAESDDALRALQEAFLPSPPVIDPIQAVRNRRARNKSIQHRETATRQDGRNLLEQSPHVVGC